MENFSLFQAQRGRRARGSRASLLGRTRRVGETCHRRQVFDGLFLSICLHWNWAPFTKKYLKGNPVESTGSKPGPGSRHKNLSIVCTALGFVFTKHSEGQLTHRARHPQAWGRRRGWPGRGCSGNPMQLCVGEGDSPALGELGCAAERARTEHTQGRSAYEPDPSHPTAAPPTLAPWGKGRVAPLWPHPGSYRGPEGGRGVLGDENSWRSPPSRPAPWASPSGPLGPLSIPFSRPCPVGTFP